MQRFRAGQSLIEVVVAIAIFAMTVSVGLTLFGYEVRQITDVQQTVRAWAMAQEGIDAARSIRDRDWNALTPGSYGLSYSGGMWSFQSASDTREGFTRGITVTDRASNERDVQVTIAWALPGGRSRSTSISSVITNWRTASSRLTGNWQNPRTLGSIDLGPGNVATGIASRPGLVYLTSTASDSKKSDFYVVDVQNPSSPTIQGSLNTGPGLSAVAVSGTRAYVANQETEEQLQILDISATSSPIILSQLSLPGNHNYATAVAVSGTTVFIGTGSSSGPELCIVDASNPATPSVLGSYEVGGDVNDIRIFNGRVFLATSKDQQELMVVNALNSATPVLTASYNATGTGDGLGVFINDQDQHAYLSRAVGGTGSDPELLVLDVTQPDAPRYLASLDVGASTNAAFAADALLFLATDNSNQELQIYNISNLPTISYYSGLNFPQVASDFGFYNNLVFVAVRSNDALRIITSQ